MDEKKVKPVTVNDYDLIGKVERKEYDRLKRRAIKFEEKNRKYILVIPCDGGLWRGVSWGVGSDGYYWSSVAYDVWSAHGLYFGVSGYLSPQGDDDRYFGFPIRCVAR